MSAGVRVTRGVQWALAGLVAYDAALAVAGWPHPPRDRPVPTRQRFRVLVAAHDEEHVVGNVVADLMGQEHERSLFRVVVLADRCSDATADVAARAGAEVVTRTAGPEGKGAALAWHLEREPLDPDEAVVVLDADTRVPGDLLSHFAAALTRDADALQANLGVSNPGVSWLTTASALTYWSGNRMVQHARARLGWSADLGGTGMCITEETLTAVGGFSAAFAEDRDLALRIILAGRRVTWMHQARVYDEKPATAGAAVRQRARWRNADRDVRRRHLGPLLRHAVLRQSPSAFDHALRLVRPGRAVLVGVSVPLAAASGLTGSSLLLRRPLWAAVAVQLLLPPVFLARDGIAMRYVLRYPLAVVVAGMALPVQVVAPRLRGRWTHTPHVGAGRPSGGP